jgi:hypothetical protein
MSDVLGCKYLLPWEKYGDSMFRRRYYDPNDWEVMGYYYFTVKDDHWEVYTSYTGDSLREFITLQEAMDAMDKRLRNIGYVLLTEETVMLM